MNKIFFITGLLSIIGFANQENLDFSIYQKTDTTKNDTNFNQGINGHFFYINDKLTIETGLNLENQTTANKFGLNSKTIQNPNTNLYFNVLSNNGNVNFISKLTFDKTNDSPIGLIKPNSDGETYSSITIDSLKNNDDTYNLKGVSANSNDYLNSKNGVQNIIFDTKLKVSVPVKKDLKLDAEIGYDYHQVTNDNRVNLLAGLENDKFLLDASILTTNFNVLNKVNVNLNSKELKLKNWVLQGSLNNINNISPKKDILQLVKDNIVNNFVYNAAIQNLDFETVKKLQDKYYLFPKDNTNYSWVYQLAKPSKDARAIIKYLVENECINYNGGNPIQNIIKIIFGGTKIVSAFPYKDTKEFSDKINETINGLNGQNSNILTDKGVKYLSDYFLNNSKNFRDGVLEYAKKSVLIQKPEINKDALEVFNASISAKSPKLANNTVIMTGLNIGYSFDKMNKLLGDITLYTNGIDKFPMSVIKAFSGEEHNLIVDLNGNTDTEFENGISLNTDLDFLYKLNYSNGKEINPYNQEVSRKINNSSLYSKASAKVSYNKEINEFSFNPTFETELKLLYTTNGFYGDYNKSNGGVLGIAIYGKNPNTLINLNLKPSLNLNYNNSNGINAYANISGEIKFANKVNVNLENTTYARANEINNLYTKSGFGYNSFNFKTELGLKFSW